jgi:hypothetical protein
MCPIFIQFLLFMAAERGSAHGKMLEEALDQQSGELATASR